MNTNGQQSDTRCLRDQGRWTSDDEIDDQTESLEDETDLTLERLLRKRVRYSMRPDPLL